MRTGYIKAGKEDGIYPLMQGFVMTRSIRHRDLCLWIFLKMGTMLYAEL